MKVLTRQDAEDLAIQIMALTAIGTLTGDEPKVIQQKAATLILKTCGIQEDETKPAGNFKLVKAD